MNAGALSSAEVDCPAVTAGYRLPWVTSASTAVGSVFSQTANFAAAFWCFDLAITAVDDPPHRPVFASPALHCGSGAIAHLPLVSGAMPASTAGPQTALGQASSVPSFIALFQA